MICPYELRGQPAAGNTAGPAVFMNTLILIIGLWTNKVAIAGSGGY
jgi:hypothetical protein